MPRKGKNKVKQWRRESPGEHKGRTLKFRQGMITMPPMLSDLARNLMVRIGDASMLDQCEKKGEVNEVI